MTVSSEIRAWSVATAALFCLSAIGYRVLTAPVIPDLAPSVTALNAALATINRPCGGGHPCGTLANVDKLMVKVGDIAVDTQRQIDQSGQLINIASQSLSSVSASATASFATLDTQLTHVGPLLDSARAATDSIPLTLAELKPPLDAGTKAMLDFDRMLQDPSIPATLANVDAMTANANGVLLDLHKVADKTTADYLKPVPWYMWPVKRSSEILDIGAAIARHTP